MKKETLNKTYNEKLEEAEYKWYVQQALNGVVCTVLRFTQEPKG
jgi:hypothetical protein